MRRIVRNPAPSALGAQVGGKSELDRARDHFVTSKRKDGFKFRTYADKAVKEALKENFEGKCAYCEAYYDATQTEDVEHYRPKGRIDNGVTKLKPGYWWLASAWDNLLPSCILCNRENNLLIYDGTTLKVGKGDRFPLDDENMRATAEGGHAGETPLLLDPTIDDPVNYLNFEDRDGSCVVVPKFADPGDLRHRRARRSIDIYGLNRHGLVKDRSRMMLLIQISLRRLERWTAELDGASPEEVGRIEREIEDEKLMLAMRVDGTDRFTGMAERMIRPVLRRLGIV